jgi:hypothetical protein
MIDNLTLAYICNDLKNAEKYKIIDGKCYYNDKYVGEIREEITTKNDELHFNIYFRPVKRIEYIEVNMTITKDGAEFKEN